MNSQAKIASVPQYNGGVLRWVGVMAPMAAQSETLADRLVGAYKQLRSAGPEPRRSACWPTKTWPRQIRAHGAAMDGKPDEKSYNRSVSGGTSNSFNGVFRNSTTSSPRRSTCGIAACHDFGRIALIRLEAAKKPCWPPANIGQCRTTEICLRAVDAYMSVSTNANSFVSLGNNVRVLTQECAAARDVLKWVKVKRTTSSLAEARAGSRTQQSCGCARAISSSVPRPITKWPWHETPRSSLARPPRLPRRVNSTRQPKHCCCGKHPDNSCPCNTGRCADLLCASMKSSLKPRVSAARGLWLDR